MTALIFLTSKPSVLLLNLNKKTSSLSDVSRQNLGIVVLEKRAGIWGEGAGAGGRGCCEPPVSLGQSTGEGPGSSTVFLIQNTSFILNLIVSMRLIIQYL